MKKILYLLLLIPLLAHTTEQDISLKEITCTTGTLSQLYNFFADQEYVLVAQGKQNLDDGKQENYLDTLFIVSTNMEYFHVVTLNRSGQHEYEDKYKGCISLSAREIDFQIKAPVENLLPRKNREHYIFFSETPKNGKCPEDETSCTPWASNGYIADRKPLVSGYTYTGEHPEDPYTEIVELNVGDKTIHPTRGALAELARTKYALRLTNELNESEEDAEAAIEIYKKIHSNVDHKLPLIVLNLTGNNNWIIYKIDQSKGLVWTLLSGSNLATFPLEIENYEEFVKTSN